MEYWHPTSPLGAAFILYSSSAAALRHPLSSSPSRRPGLPAGSAQLISMGNLWAAESASPLAQWT